MKDSEKNVTELQRANVFDAENISILSFIKSPDNVIEAFTHCHEEYEFIIPRTPLPFLVNESAVYLGNVGYVFPVCSGQTHGIKYSISDVSHDDIIINKRYFEQLLRNQGRSDIHLNSSFRAGDELLMYIRAFKKEFTEPEGHDNHKLRHLTALICYEIIDSADKIKKDNRHETIGYQQGLRSSAEFIGRNFDKPLKLDELASMCGLSPNYFSSRFKLMYGESPFLYLTRLRISTAKNMLAETSMSLSEIAENCGFGTICNLSSVFKASEGITPSEYRSKIK